MTLPPLRVPQDTTSFIPDPLADAERYEGLLLRRMLAVTIDWFLLLIIAGLFWLIGSVVWVLTFGLATPLLALLGALLPILYHSLLIAGSRAATVGMRAMGLRAYSMLSGRPTLVQALVHTVVFYGSIGMTAFLILAVPLFNRQRRTLHDFLSGVIILRTPREEARLPSG